MNVKRLNTALKYLINRYNGIGDIIAVMGYKRPISTILTNLYQFRKLEDYGYSLEDIFMDVYLNILDMRLQNIRISNLTQSIQDEIFKCIKDDMIISRVIFDNMKGSSESKLSEIQLRRVDYDFDEDIDYSVSDAYDHIFDKAYVECVFQNSHLRSNEEELIRKNIMEDNTLVSISEYSDLGAARLGQIRNKALRKIRDSVKILEKEYELSYNK